MTTKSSPNRPVSPKPTRTPTLAQRRDLEPLSVQRALAAPLSASPAQILQLQRLIGNRAVSGLVQRAQGDRAQAKGTIQLLRVHIHDRGIVDTTEGKWERNVSNGLRQLVG
ncbi:MAG: hypothetical protein H0T73_17005 [Ardenticatenales bacterium]|nr:hypothetical protein [Ardenticatenales bacterium]